MFTFLGDENQGEILQHSDSLNFFKILINHEAFWQPPRILHNPYLISHSLKVLNLSGLNWHGLTAWGDWWASRCWWGRQLAPLRVCADIPLVSARGDLMTNVLTWM